MNELISELVGYGIEKGLVEEDDKIYVINRLLELFRLDSYTQTDKACLLYTSPSPRDQA